MKATIKWIDGVSFVGESESGHAVVMDGPPTAGGRNIGIRPMELLLIGMGGCSAFDVVTILMRGRQELVDCRAELEAERASEDPKVFTRIHLHFVITGRNLKPAVVERAIRLSAEKYCSASIMLGKTAQLTHDFEIIDAEPGANA
ncbi:MAG: OsmC family protein [Gammaproteobacteria bacterium]|nr:OsmC family protein [Gammaproteobacteria bacterium]